MTVCVRLKWVCFIAIAIFVCGCQPLMRMATGISSQLEYTMDNSQRLNYYHPYLEAANLSIYTLKNPEEFCKNINYFGTQISMVYFEDMANKQYYMVNCFDDIKLTFEDLNKGDLSLLKPMSEEDFAPIKNYISQSSERVFHQENQQQTKRWNVYLTSGTFMGNKLKKRTASITKIEELNQLHILDLSVDSTDKTISEHDFQTAACTALIKEKADYLR